MKIFPLKINKTYFIIFLILLFILTTQLSFAFVLSAITIFFESLAKISWYFANLFTTIFVFLFDRFILNFSEIATHSVVRDIWIIVRDATNILIVFLFIIKALKLVLKNVQLEDKIGDTIKKELLTLMIAAILINFGAYIVLFFLDLSHIAASLLIGSGINLDPNFLSLTGNEDDKTFIELSKGDLDVDNIAFAAFEFVKIFAFGAFGGLMLAFGYLVFKRTFDALFIIITSPIIILGLFLSSGRLNKFAKQSLVRFQNVLILPVILSFVIYIVPLMSKLLADILYKQSYAGVTIDLIIIVVTIALVIIMLTKLLFIFCWNVYKVREISSLFSPIVSPIVRGGASLAARGVSTTVRWGVGAVGGLGGRPRGPTWNQAWSQSKTDAENIFNPIARGVGRTVKGAVKLAGYVPSDNKKPDTLVGKGIEVVKSAGSDLAEPLSKKDLIFPEFVTSRLEVGKPEGKPKEGGKPKGGEIPEGMEKFDGFKVPEEEIGKVIGKKGETIKKIKREVGINIHIDKEDGTIYFSEEATDEQKEQAIKMIKEIIKEEQE